MAHDLMVMAIATVDIDGDEEMACKKQDRESCALDIHDVVDDFGGKTPTQYSTWSGSCQHATRGGKVTSLLTRGKFASCSFVAAFMCQLELDEYRSVCSLPTIDDKLLSNSSIVHCSLLPMNYLSLRCI